jgi:hypothetical protein
MAILNRDKDSTEQRDNYSLNGNGVIGVSALIPIFNAPCAQQMLALQVAAFGVSGTPILTPAIQRFIVGSGLTTIVGGFTALSVSAAFGTSGPVTLTPLVSGSTLVQLQKNDVFLCVTSGANSAGNYVMNAVAQTLQDVKSTYGV